MSPKVARQSLCSPASEFRSPNHVCVGEREVLTTQADRWSLAARQGYVRRPATAFARQLAAAYKRRAASGTAKGSGLMPNGQIPLAPARLIGRQWVVTRCPYCERKHYHGAGPVETDAREHLGHRLAHCGRGGTDGYVLVEESA